MFFFWNFWLLFLLVMFTNHLIMMLMMVFLFWIFLYVLDLDHNIQWMEPCSILPLLAIEAHISDKSRDNLLCTCVCILVACMYCCYHSWVPREYAVFWINILGRVQFFESIHDKYTCTCASHLTTRH